MKANRCYVRLASGWLSVSVCATAFCAWGAASPKASSAGASAPAATNSTVLPEIPRSVFAIPSSPKEGRNPFFPQAAVQPAPAPAKPEKTSSVETSSFVLNGITSPPKRTAIINNRTFERGESGEVKLGNGSKILIKCVDIRNDSAVIEVDGQQRELRLRFGV